MQIMVMNPSHPKDKSKAVALSKEQFSAVHDYIVDQMNSRKRIKDATIIQKLKDAGLAICWQNEPATASV